MNRNQRKWLRSPIERVGTLSHTDLPPPAPVTAARDEEALLVRALQERDEDAFVSLLDQLYSPMLRLARAYVRSREEAEEAVQDTWLAVLGGLGRFEGRSSLKTWIFRILVNRARTRAKREARLVPFSSVEHTAAWAPSEWSTPISEWLLSQTAVLPLPWHGGGLEPPSPDSAVLSAELNARVESAIRCLPPRQQAVITLRDLEGWAPEEVCTLLEISEANQRVLLHRARVRVRDALESYFAPPDPAAEPALSCPA
jgi:RNA polymerase sigma-70 factor (ECF subfamily)